jgi:hypothetical protein
LDNVEFGVFAVSEGIVIAFLHIAGTVVVQIQLNTVFI